MKMKMDGFKKVHEDEHSATLMHSSGHKIVVSKKALNDKLKGDLKSLPMFSAGGAVTPIDDPNQPPPPDAPFYGSMTQGTGFDKNGNNPNQADAQPEQASKPFYGSMAQGTDADPGTQQTSLPDQPQKQAQAPTNYTPSVATRAPTSADDTQKSAVSGLNGTELGMYNKAFKEGAQGIQEKAAADSAMGEDRLALEQKNQADTEKFNKTYVDKAKEIDDHISKAVQDVKDGHIDPKHYMNSMSTAGKVSTAIGLILGGMGGGLTGQENPALKFLNSQIDRDVEAQKADLGKKENILSAYMKQYGNLNDATRMTYAFYNDLYKSQINEMLAKNATPQAQSAAHMALYALDSNRAKEIGPLVTRQAILSSQASGSLSPETQVRFLVPEAKQAEVLKNIQEQQNHQRQSTILNDDFNKMLKENTIGNRIMHGGAEPASVAGFKLHLQPYFRDADGKLNEFALEHAADAMVTGIFSGKHKDETMRANLNSWLKEKEPIDIAGSYGVKLPHQLPQTPKLGRAVSSEK